MTFDHFLSSVYGSVEDELFGGSATITGKLIKTVLVL
jgi:hypothetical protein